MNAAAFTRPGPEQFSQQAMHSGEMTSQLPPLEAVQQADQAYGTSGVYRGGNYQPSEPGNGTVEPGGQAAEGQALGLGQAEQAGLPETAASREKARVLGPLGEVAARGVAIADEKSYADPSARGKLFSAHLTQMVTFLGQMRTLNEQLMRAKHDEDKADTAEDTDETPATPARGTTLQTLLSAPKSNFDRPDAN